MKICPQCQTTYADESLQFCLEDGSRLATLANQSSQMPTQSFSEEETVVARSQPTWEQSRVTQISGIQPQTSKSNNTTAVLVTVLIMTLIFSVGGVGAWIYFRKAQPEIVQNINTKSSPQTNNSNAKFSPTPTISASPSATNADAYSNDIFKKTPSATPTPDVDSEQIRNQVSSKIYNWKSGLESGSLSSVMSNYADRLDYYFNKGAISASAVRNDKQRAFTLFNSFHVILSNMRVTPDAGGEKATAVFDKEWIFTGAKTNSGKVQSQLQLTKISGQWLITGEKDLRVYYVNK